jgi:tetratricopeptide (TPR) repeat protein
MHARPIKSRRSIRKSQNATKVDLKLDSRKIPALTLCVIARNAAETLAHCLASVQGLVSAMVVVDTGSTDATIEVAGAAGARCVQFCWNNDFAAARNAALQQVKTEWVLVLDADEEIDGAAHAWIRAELRAPRADGYVVSVRNYLQPWDEPLDSRVELRPEERHPRAADARLYAPSQVCRLFRRRPDVYYVGQVHEQVEYRMLQLGLVIKHAGFFIHHFGWYLLNTEESQRKRGLYRELLAEKLRERPDDAQVLMQYGDALCSWCGKVAEGLACFLKAAELHPEFKQIWSHIAPALIRVGQAEAALIAIEQIPRDAASAGRRAQLRGEALASLGRWQEAGREYERALEHYPGYAMLRAKLGLVQMAAGAGEAGEAHVRAAIAIAEHEAMLRPTSPSLLRAAEMHAQLRHWSDVLRVVEIGLRVSPESEALQELRLRAAVAVEDMPLAAESARWVAAQSPSPRASLRHAAILMKSGDAGLALAALDDGLARFPLEPTLCRARTELALQGAAQ